MNKRREGLKQKNSSVRRLAYQTILRVKTGGAYSNVLVSQTINRYGLSERDRGFYTELVYGTLENLLFLDYVIQKFSKTKIDKMDQSRLIVLEMGLYQIRYMDSVESFAAVYEMVELMKRLEPKTKAHSYVNAVLRNVLRDPSAFDIEVEGIRKRMSIEYSVSPWIVERLLEAYGQDKTEDILYSLMQRPNMFLRVNEMKLSSSELMESLSAKGIAVQTVEGFPNMLKVKNLKGIEGEEGYRKGHYSIQDLSSQVCIEALSPQSGEKILDLCAAPGGKTTAIAERMKGAGEVVSADVAKNKLGLIQTSVERLGLKNVHILHQDATQKADEWEEAFDRVLVDVPCSGIGIIRRKPELRYKNGDSFRGLSQVQKSILECSASYVKKDGILVYSTCTLNREENVGVIEDFLRKHKEFEPEEFEIPGMEKKRAMAELLPDEGEWDGFFICKMKKKSN